MSKEQTAPKEIWVDKTVFDSDNFNDIGVVWSHISNFYAVEADIKYLSETHVKELLSDKDKEIERLKQEVDSLKGKNKFLNDHIITITESNNQAFDELKKHYQGNNNQVLFVAEEMKWCDCKNLEHSTAGFYCNGKNCRY